MIFWANFIEGQQKTANDPPYKIEKFKHHPGIFFENIGTLHQESSWKLVARIDITALARRLTQLQGYVTKSRNLCHVIATTNIETCLNLNTITETRYKKLNTLISKIISIYKLPRLQRRGLIDGIGSISKSLFGTMDANDEKLINEQMTVLQNAQLATQHAIKNQIKILQATIAHIDDTEKTIQTNENLLANTINKLREQLLANEKQTDMDEHFIVINAILTDLTRDAEDILEYLMSIKLGKLHPRLIPIEQIMKNLQEASLQLPEGLYFPFRATETEWPKIEKLATVNAYYNTDNIFTIIHFPLVSLPKYKLINVIALPVRVHENTFAFIETETPLIAINTEGRT